LEQLGQRKVFAADTALAEIGDEGIGTHVCFPAEPATAIEQEVATAQNTDEAFAAMEFGEGENEGEVPEINNFDGVEDQGGAWLLTGAVSDDGPVDGLYVWFYFNGSYAGYTLTGEDGSFSFAIIVPEGDYGFVEAYVIDSEAMGSGIVYKWVDNV
jgi:hypothetical protein